MLALEGITVLAIEQAVAVPYATSRLADAGARVIKVERDSGDFARGYDTLAKGESAYFVWLNRGKESLCLNLKQEDDRDLLKRIARDADVVIQNLKPGSLEKLGLGLDGLRALNPRLITCNVSGFGTEGAYAHLKAYDLIVQAESGLCSITGTPEAPARVGVSVCDISAGMSAHAAVLEALLLRERTGEGSHIEVSLFDALADWMNVPYLQRRYGDRDTQRIGVNHASLAPYGAYRCSDGVDIVFSVQNDREWVLFCKHILNDEGLTRRDGFADNMQRLSNRAALDDLIVARFSSVTSDEMIKELETTGIAYGRLNTIDGLISHPHLRTLKVSTAGGEIDVIAPGAQNRSAQQVDARIPSIGEHTATIRSEFTS